MSDNPNNWATIDDWLWHHNKTTPQEYIFWTTLGVAAASYLLCLVVSLTIQYFGLYNNSDHILAKVGIGLGTSISVGLLGLELYKAYNLSEYGVTDYSSIFHEDQFVLVTLILFTVAFALPAWWFYTYRAWNLFHRNKYYLAITLPMTILPPAFVIVLCVEGYRSPEVSLANIPALSVWQGATDRWSKFAAVSAVGVDIWLCGSILVGLRRSKERFLHMHKSLISRLTRLAFETMIPPSLLLLSSMFAVIVPNGHSSNFRTCSLFTYPLAYYQCLLYCLVARQDVREMVESQLASGGIGMLSDPEERNNSNRTGVYVSTTQHVHREDAESVKASERSSATEVFAMSPMSTENKDDWTTQV